MKKIWKILLLSLTNIFVFLTFFFGGYWIIAETSDLNSREIQLMHENNVNSCLLTGRYNFDSFLHRTEDNNGYGFTPKQIKLIQEYVGYEDLIKVVDFSSSNRHYFNWDSSGFFNYSKNINVELFPENKDSFHTVLLKNFDGFFEVNENFNLLPDSRLINKNVCRFPSNYNEIAITSFKADLFLEYGYKSDDGEIVEIKSVDDLIGKTWSGYTISGVYEAGYSLDDYLKEVDNLSNAHLKEVYQSINTLHNYLFMKEGTLNHYLVEVLNKSENTMPFKYYVNMKDDVSKNKRFIKSLKYTSNDEIGQMDNRFYYSVLISSPYSSMVHNTQNYAKGLSFVRISFVISIVAAFFFLDNHVCKKMKERLDINSSNKDRFKLLYKIALKFSVPLFALALIVNFIVLIVMSIINNCWTYYMGVLPLVLFIILSGLWIMVVTLFSFLDFRNKVKKIKK